MLQISLGYIQFRCNKVHLTVVLFTGKINNIFVDGISIRLILLEILNLSCLLFLVLCDLLYTDCQFIFSSI